MSFDTCSSADFVDNRKELVITQYRESENLRFLIDTYLGQLAAVIDALCEIKQAFDIDTATDDPLCIIGASVGWPKEHCTGKKAPVFGFACAAGDCGTLGLEIEGFCDNAEQVNVNFRCECLPALQGYTFTDDALYRRFIKAKIESHKADYSHDGIKAALALLFDNTDVIVATGHDATINLYTGRVLSAEELSISPLFQHVLPIAPGVGSTLWQTDGSPPFGFGAGWGEFCDDWAQHIHDF